MDKHLRLLSQQHPNTQFLSINAQTAPFFVQKLGIRTLPTLCVFIDGVLKDKLLGFDGLSGDEFLTWQLAQRLQNAGVITSGPKKKDRTILKSKKQSRDSESDSD